jgi:hypothetical protein
MANARWLPIQFKPKQEDPIGAIKLSFTPSHPPSDPSDSTSDPHPRTSPSSPIEMLLQDARERIAQLFSHPSIAKEVRKRRVRSLFTAWHDAKYQTIPTPWRESSLI